MSSEFIVRGSPFLELRHPDLGGRHLWSTGYYVSTVGLDEDQIRKYVRLQEEKDKVAEQVGLWDN